MYKEYKSLNVLDVELKLFEGPINVFVSGGADSALLLFLLMSHHNDKIHVITESNILERKNSFIVPNIINKCIQITENSNVIHHTIYLDRLCGVIDLTDTIKDWFNKELFYVALNERPPKEVEKTFKSKFYQPPHVLKHNVDRNPESEKLVIINNEYVPFHNINKRKIADIYNHYNLINVLFPLTRSCTWYKNGEWLADPNTPDPGFNHCNNCWWCEERNWGFRPYI